jgi:hypothetical protein
MDPVQFGDAIFIDSFFTEYPLLEFFSLAFDHAVATAWGVADARGVLKESPAVAAAFTAAIEGLARQCAEAAKAAEHDWPPVPREIPARNQASVENVSSPSPPPRPTY